MTQTLTPPTADEYAPFYADYIQRVLEKDILSLLPQQIEDIKSTVGHLSDDQARFRFEPGQWSIKEVIGHLNDGERVFSYRILRISRNDTTPLAYFEQEGYVREAGFDQYPLGDLIGEFEFLRRANILAIKNMPDKAILYRGTASGAAVSVRALIHMLAGHVEHHMESLRSKYLSSC